MAPQVDTGGIVAVRRFHLFEHDSVYSLTQRCYTHIFGLFYTVMWGVLAGRSLPRSDETWPRLPYRRAELDALCRVSPDMPREEMRRRIRATTFPGAPGPYLEMHGIRFCVAEARGSAA
jgi:methionyl-tRNA formyltransferase